MKVNTQQKVPDKKIVQIINSLSEGGAERLLFETLLEYSNQGISIDLIILYSYNYHVMSDKLKALKNIKVYHSYPLNPYSPLHIFYLWRMIKSYDIIHVHLFPVFYWIRLAALFRFGRKRKYIFTEHSTNNKRRKQFFGKLIDHWIYNGFNKIVCVSELAETNLISHLGSQFAPRITTISNGVPLNKIKDAKGYSKSDFGFKDSDFIILQVSRFVYPKDQDTLIKALALLPEEYKLLLVGKGPKLEDSKKFAESLNLKNRCLFLEARNDVPRLLRTSDVVVLSSEYEGLSLSSVEGLASGNPFICTDAPGLRDVVQGYGLLFNVGDYRTLSELIRKSVEDETFRAQVINKCLERSKDYDIIKMISDYFSIYRELAN